jgi:hypothetical protein
VNCLITISANSANSSIEWYLHLEMLRWNSLRTLVVGTFRGRAVRLRGCGNHGVALLGLTIRPSSIEILQHAAISPILYSPSWIPRSPWKAENGARLRTTAEPERWLLNAEETR